MLQYPSVIYLLALLRNSFDQQFVFGLVSVSGNAWGTAGGSPEHCIVGKEIMSSPTTSWKRVWL